jgi:hypothetical protein
MASFLCTQAFTCKAESSPRPRTEPLIACKQEAEQRGRKGKGRGAQASAAVRYLYGAQGNVRK